MDEEKYTVEQIEGALLLAAEKLIDRAIADGAPENINLEQAVEYLSELDSDDPAVAAFMKIAAMLPQE